MRPGILRDIGQWLAASDSRVGELINAAKEQSRRAAKIDACIPEALRGHCQFSHLSSDCVVIDCESAAWATKLRYMNDDIVAAVQQAMNLPIGSVKARVRPGAKTTSSPAEKPRAQSPGNDPLTSCAVGIKDDELRESLLKLADSVAKRNQKPSED